MRLEPHAIGRLSARLEHGSAVISATNGKTTTAAMVATILERGGTRLVHNRAGREHGRRRGERAAAGRAPRRPARGRHRALRGRRVLARPGRRRAPSRAPCCSRTSSATSSTATASSTRSPTAGLDVCARTSAALVLNADDPTVADLGRARGGDARTAACPSSGSRTTRSPCPRCSTPPTPSTAAAAARRTATTRSTSATSAATTATRCGATPPGAAVAAATDVVLEGVRGARFTLRTPGRRARRRASAPRPLQRLQRARGRGAGAHAGRPSRRRRRRPAGGLPRVRPGRDGAPRRPRPVDPPREEPGRGERGPAHARARARRARRARHPQRPGRRRARRELGVGRGLRGPRRRACGT